VTTRSFHLPEALHDYLVAVSCREHSALADLRAATAALEEAHYQIAPEQGQLLAFLLELLGARRTLDIGTFTGYSALAAALAMPADGRVVTFDLTDRFAGLARQAWRQAGMAERIDFRVGPAVEGLRGLVEEGREGAFDFAFVDADKEGYPDYYELALRLLRPGGVVAVDNTLWRGRVADPADARPRTVAVRTLNDRIRDDARVTPVMLPMGDGLTLARKRG
jgi:caffeoyl-CoA O-methyltransferase